MRQLYLQAPNDLRLREIEDPLPGPGEVVISVQGATTCGTDLKTLMRGHPKFPMPTAFGHEFSGIIDSVGEGVEKWRVGMEVMCAPTAPCGACSLCRRGLFNLCPSCMDEILLGAFAQKVRVPAHIVAQNLYPKPPHLDFFEAALMEPLACAVYGQQVLPPLQGKSVVIIGAGPIGLLHQMLALEQRPSNLIMVGRREARLAIADEIGADEIVDSEQEPNLLDAVLARTGGLGADVVIECTGQPDVWVDSVHITASAGTTLLFGGCKGGTQVTLPMDQIWQRALTVLGVFHITPEAVAKAREHLCLGRLPVEHLITEVRPMSDFQQIFEDLKKGRAVKYGIDPQA